MVVYVFVIGLICFLTPPIYTDQDEVHASLLLTLLPIVLLYIRSDQDVYSKKYK